MLILRQLLLVLCAGLSFCQAVYALPKLQLSAAEQQWLAQHPVIKLGISEEFSLALNIDEQGRRSGIIVDYLALLNAVIGQVHLQLHTEATWRAVTERALQREIDGLATSSPNPVWDQYFLYSAPYYQAQFHIYAPSHTLHMNYVEDLVHKRVGYLEGSQFIKYWLSQHPDIIAIALPSSQAISDALLNQQIDAALGLTQLEWWRRQHGINGFKITGVISNSAQPIVISIRNDWPELQSIINKAMHSIPDSELAQIRDRWLNQTEMTPTPLVPLDAEERAYLQQLKLTRALGKGWMPFNFLNPEGEVTGITEDYWQLIANKLNLRAEPTEALFFSEILLRLQHGEVDLYASTTRTPERELFANFSETYDQFPIAIASRKAQQFLTSAASLEGKTVAVGKNYSAYYLLKKRYPKIRFQQVRDTTEALKCVENGSTFAAVDILPVLQYHIKQLNSPSVHLVGVTDVMFNLQVMVRKGHEPLIPLLNRAIHSITPEERLQIHRQWILNEVIEKTDYSLVWKTLTISLIIIVFILYWNRRLAREIHRRQCAERALNVSELRYQSLVDGLGPYFLLYIQNGEGKLEFVSKGFSHIFGTSHEQALGKSLSEITQWDAEDLHLLNNKQAQLQPKQHVIEQLRFIHPNGSKRTVITTFHRVLSKQGAERIEGVMQDITEHKLAEQQLHETSERLRSILASLDDLVFVLDAEGRYIDYYPDEDERLKDLPPSVFMGRTYHEILPKHIVEKINLAIHEAQSGKAQHFEYALHLSSGDHWFNASISARYDASAQFVGSTIVARDISHRKRAELALKESEQRLRHLGDNLHMGVIFQKYLGEDEEFYYTYISAGVQPLLGVQAEEIMHNAHILFSMLHPEDHERVLAASYQASHHLQPLEVTFRCYTKKHKLRWLYVRSRSYLNTDGLVWTDGFAMDITSQKQIEQELIQARAAAEAANRAKSAFLANMSHELRTPLNAVLGFAQIMEKAADLNPDYQRMINTINRSGEYLLTLLNDILDLSKIEAGRFEITKAPCHLPSLLNGISEVFSARATQKELVFKKQLPETLPNLIETDEKRLRQVLMNLLGNAFKFTEQGRVELICQYQQDTLKLSIRDTGIGIAANKLKDVFTPFQQAGEERYKAQGTGLGLAISHNIVVMMGGTLSVSSQLGAGSCFVVTLPAPAIQQQLSTSSAELPSPHTICGYRRSSGNAAYQVLIVDDVSNNCELLSRMLQPLGFITYSVQSGESCLAFLRQQQVDIILMDLKMPGISGLEATQQIRAQHIETPIIVVSASTFPEDQIAAHEAGCTDKIDKPIKQQDLLCCLQKHLALEWQYQAEPHAPGNDLSPRTALPEAHQQALLALIHSGKINKIFDYLQNLQQQAAYAKEAAQLLSIAKSFDLAKLRSRLQAK